jgi:uncharacterized protein YodC (DUF2158 family)
MFQIGDRVLQKYFENAPEMVVVNIVNDIYHCRYEQNGSFVISTFSDNELKPALAEVVNQTICKGDYVTNKYLFPSPIMRVVKDYNNEQIFGCRYLSNGVFYYMEFEHDELELLDDDGLQKIVDLEERKRYQVNK